MVWQTGQKLQGGKYEIIKVLGRGGFGITYHARHIKLSTEVVIKTPDLLQQKDIEYEQYVQQFQEEGQRLAKFSAKPHPHIVKVRDYFLEETLPCLVMDFIRGHTLMEIIKTQRCLSEKQCLIYIRQIGKALETIHKAKMVHRDAHPGNIMIQDGEAILIDFGIAKNIIPATHSVTSNAANPSFAPYEQIYRGSREREYTIDVYTLAATFYYAVTGKRPTPSMERKLNDKSVLIPPKQINRQLSDHINEAILEGMALEKEYRPQSISAWLGLLEPPQPPPNIRRYSHQSRKIPWIPLIVLFLVYSIIGTIVLITQHPLWAIAWFMALSIMFFVNTALAQSIAEIDIIFLLFTSMLLMGYILWLIIWAWTVAGALAAFIAYLMYAACAWSMTHATLEAVEKLKEEIFSPLHQSLILSGVSLSGLVLGFLVGWLIKM